MRVPPVHKRVAGHFAGLFHRATWAKYAVTCGVCSAAYLTVIGLDHQALTVSILTNLVWIWE